MIQQHDVESNKAVLEADTERDELHNQIEQIEEQMHPKRALTHDDDGDAHELLAEDDNFPTLDLECEENAARRSEVGFHLVKIELLNPI